MFLTQLGKYKTIVVSIALFLLLDASVLILNFYISFEIADDAVGVNLAGRQRMLSQRMVKSLYDMELSDATNTDIAKQELQTTVSLFDSTLTAFDNGGTVKGAGGNQVTLQKVQSSDGRAAIEAAKIIWTPYKKKLNAVLQSNDIDDTTGVTADLIVFAKENNLTLLRLMNDLTVNLENVATSKATRLRMIQTVGISLAVINFLIILFHFIRQLNSSDRALDRARSETEEILETVNEGLFLINSDLSIASQYSHALETLFARNDIAGKSLEDILSEVIKPKDLENTKRFIALLFKEEIKSKLITDLNPLKEIEVSIPDTEGSLTHKYFRFEFQRAYEGTQIKDILVTVSDITEKVTLERELEATKEQSQQQLEVLTGILHANPSVLRAFVDESFGAFERINILLRKPAKTDSSLRKKLEEIFFEIHKLKGEASALSLENYVELTHEFELEMSELRGRERLNGDDFLPLVVRLEKLIKHSESVRVLSEKLAKFSGSPTTSEAAAITNDWAHLDDLAESSADRLDKSVQLVTCGLNDFAMDNDIHKVVNDVMIQGIRNAVAHGIESKHERLEQSKPEYGRIDVRLSKLSDASIELVIEDDGEGINTDRIRSQAIASGRWTEAELESWDKKRITSLIFEPGFSTEQEHNVDAGSGVGMEIIRKRLSDLRGKIRISSRKGHGTKLVFSFPPKLGSKIAA
jgi:HPt (histidine-containing phosphotransfer) domain-containing protein